MKEKQKERKEIPQPTEERERTRQVIQIIAVRRTGTKITKVKTLAGDVMTVEDLRNDVMAKGIPVVAVAPDGNVTAIGPRDETMISSLPDDTILNNLQHLAEF